MLYIIMIVTNNKMHSTAAAQYPEGQVAKVKVT